MRIADDVGFWHLADICHGLIDVRYWGVKRTCVKGAAKSAFDPKRTSALRVGSTLSALQDADLTRYANPP